MQRIEVEHYTVEQVEKIISNALLIAGMPNLDDAMRVPVFQEAVRLLGAKTVQAVTPAQGMFVPPLA